MPRFTEFTFKAPLNARGRPAVRLPGVPARDLVKRDVNRLTDEEYEAVKAARRPDGEALYEPVRKRKHKSDRASDESAEAEDGQADEGVAVEVEEVAGDEPVAVETE